MKPLPSLIAIATSLALYAAPSGVPAQDDLEDLEVTMEVVDGALELDAMMSEMRGPDEPIETYDEMEGPGRTSELKGSEGGLGGTSAEPGLEAAPYRDRFEGDRLEGSNVRLPQSDQAFEDEVDWEEEEHVDQDEYDELPDLYDDAVEMDDEPPF